MHREERTMTTIYLIRHAEAEGNVFRRKEDLAHSAVGKCPAELLDSDDPRCIVEFFEHRFTPPDCSVCMLTQS